VRGNSVKKGAASELNADGPTGGILESFLDYRTATGGKMQGVESVGFPLLLGKAVERKLKKNLRLLL
jgi:hypothetical protein